MSNKMGEIPLSSFDSCRLLALNLYGYVVNPFTKDAYFDFELFKKDVQIAQRFMDDIIDLELEKVDKILKKIKIDGENDFTKETEIYLWERVKKAALNGRRTGLGITALGDMLAALGLRYGSDEGTEFAVKVQRTIKLEAYRSSMIMAKERGAFPIYDAKREENNPFLLRIKNEDPELYHDIVKYGRRNIALLTIAPTGSASVLCQTTSGIEPAFSVYYKRRKKINPNDKNVRVDFIDGEGVAFQEYYVFHHKFEDWLSVQGYDVNVVKNSSDAMIEQLYKLSPYYLATANDVDWVSKVKMQGKMQLEVDHSISVTVNLPQHVDEQLVANVYETGWKSGCKGITVYRDGSRSGILVSASDKSKETEKFVEHHAIKRPKRLQGEIVRFQNKSEKWIAVVGVVDNRPYEIFTGKLEDGMSDFPIHVNNCEIVKNKFDSVDETGKPIKKSRYDVDYIDVNGKKQTFIGISSVFNPIYYNYAKLISGNLRHGMPLISAYQLIDSLKFDEDHINTWKNGVCRVIKRYIKDGEVIKSVCPNCGSNHLEFKEGCLTCMECGNSKCS